MSLVADIMLLVGSWMLTLGVTIGFILRFA